MEPEAWKKGMAHEFSLYKLAMWPIGNWPGETHKKFANLRSSIAVTIEILVVFGVLLELLNNTEIGIYEQITYISILVCGILAFLKIVLLHINLDNVRKTFAEIANNWITQTLQEKEVMARYADLGRFVFFMQMGICSFIVTTILLQSLFDELPNNTSVVLPQGTCNKETFPVNCNWLYLLQTAQLIITAFGNTGTDLFFFGIAMHISGQLDILRNEFSKIGFANRNEKPCQADILSKLKRHNLLVNLAQTFENTVYLILLGQLCLNGLLICLFGFQTTIALHANETVNVVRSVAAFSMLITQLFLYSYMGESLSSKLEAIGHDIYLCNWQNLPPKIVKDLRFVMLYTGMPFNITAGKFYSMNFENFKNIIKASMSYFSLLQVMFTD